VPDREPIDAKRAAEIGLINHVAPAGELDAKTDWLLQRLTGKSPTALRRGKVMMRAAFDMTFEQSISFLETQIMTLALTEDARKAARLHREARAHLDGVEPTQADWRAGPVACSKMLPSRQRLERLDTIECG